MAMRTHPVSLKAWLTLTLSCDVMTWCPIVAVAYQVTALTPSSSWTPVSTHDALRQNYALWCSDYRLSSFVSCRSCVWGHVVFSPTSFGKHFITCAHMYFTCVQHAAFIQNYSFLKWQYIQYTKNIFKIFFKHSWMYCVSTILWIFCVFCCRQQSCRFLTALKYDCIQDTNFTSP